MGVGRNLAFASLLLAIGLSTALLFRKDQSELQPPVASQDAMAFRERVQRRVLADSQWAKGLTQNRATQTLRVPSALPASIGDGTAGDSQPRFERTHNPVGALLGPIRSADDERLPGDSVWPIADEREPREPRPDVHTVQDGDTLTRLATRYLGHADRYLEIYELNRDVLASPDLLPLGTRIRIPPFESSEIISGSDTPPLEAVPPKPEAPRVVSPDDGVTAVTELQIAEPDAESRP